MALSAQLVSSAGRVDDEVRRRGRRAGWRRRSSSTPPPHLFARWRQVGPCLRAASRLALFLDFDGTLTPLRRRPSDVSLSRATRMVLDRLARCEGVDVCILSGRRRADLQRRIGLTGVAGLRTLGLFGWEDSDERDLPAPTAGRVREARDLLAGRLRGLKGVWIEDKGATVAIHYRGAPPVRVRDAEQKLEAILESFEPDLRLVSGKKVWELVPHEIQGKGEALRHLMAGPQPEVLGIYVGDDSEDEEAFRALPDGITVHVGPPSPTAARFRLDNPRQVREFLERLEAAR